MRLVDDRSLIAQGADGLAVEVVLVLMGDKNDVGLGEVEVVGDGLNGVADGIDLYLRAVEVDFKTGVLDARNFNAFA